MADLRCLPLKKVTDGPIFGQPLGTLAALSNMRLRPDGYAEARGGFDELKPSGGTAANPISAGGYSSAHQMATSYGWVRSFDQGAGAGSQYSKNLQLSEGGWPPFPNVAVNDALYIGSDLPFSRIAVRLSQSGLWVSITIAYEYWNGSTWSALTTAETVNFSISSDETTTFNAPQAASWTMPTDWAASTVGDSGTGNVLKYWMRLRVTAVNGAIQTPTISYMTIFSVGMRELYVASQSPRTSATSGTLKRQGQSGTTEEWFTINSSMFASTTNPTRMASYRGRLYLVNGKDQKRWDGANYSDIGLAKPDLSTLTVTPSVLAGTALGAGIWRYYVAYGYGTVSMTSLQTTLTDPQVDPMCLYGVSEAVYIGAEVTTTAGNERPTIDFTGTMPADISAILIYRTNDLTNVAAGERTIHPAKLVGCLYRVEPGTNPANHLNSNGGIVDELPAQISPPVEATQFSNLPPTNCKYLCIYQNRLFLMDDDTIFWSDPFQPDSFSGRTTTAYMRLARASGGRHMGIVEYADQVVAYTEDQTWGITNVDLDVPQLFPIHPGVGCIAPDAIASGDGYLIWPARDGIYLWDGSPRAPRHVSSDRDVVFGKLSFESHGGSRAVIEDRQYKIRLSAPGDSTPGAAYALDLDTLQWGDIEPTGFSSVLAPLALIHGPLGSQDPGKAHSLWGKIDYGTGAGEYGLFMAELTTQDDGTNYTCSAQMPFPQPPSSVFSPRRVIAYYQAANGWQTPTMTVSAQEIGTETGTIGMGTEDTSTNYNVIAGVFSQVGRGSSDIKVTFSVSSQAGGSVNGQRFFGAILEGEVGRFRRGGPSG